MSHYPSSLLLPVTQASGPREGLTTARDRVALPLHADGIGSLLENQDTRPGPPGWIATNAGRVGNETASTSRLKGNLALPISAQGRWRASLKSQKTQASKERLANDEDSVLSGLRLLGTW